MLDSSSSVDASNPRNAGTPMRFLLRGVKRLGGTLNMLPGDRGTGVS